MFSGMMQHCRDVIRSDVFLPSFGRWGWRKTFLLLLLISQSVHSQNFLHRSKGDGLPSNSVKCFAQDADGYLWVGTTQGLCRYDGVNFIVYQQGDSISTESCNFIHSLAIMRDSLLIGTSQGLCMMSSITGDYRYVAAINDPVTHIAVTGKTAFVRDNGGKLWQWEPGSEFRQVMPEESWRAVWVKDSSDLLLLTPHQLVLADIQTLQTISRIEVEMMDPEWNNLYYSQLMQVIVVGGGLGYATQCFRIGESRLVPAEIQLPPNVKAVADSQGVMWLATDGQGLWRYDGQLKQFTPHSSLIHGFAIHALFADHEDNLWVGNYRAGIDVCPSRASVQHHLTVANSKLAQNVVTGLTVYQGKVYAGIDGGGLNIVNPANNQVTILNTVNSQLPGDNIISLASDDRYIWMGIYDQGICRYDPIDHTFCPVDLTVRDSVESMNHLWHLWNEGPNRIAVQDNEDSRWVVDKQALRLTAQKPNQDNPQAALVRLISALGRFHGTEVYCAATDEKQLLWVGTDNGLYAIPKSECFGPYPVYKLSFSRLHLLTGNKLRLLPSGKPGELHLCHDENFFTITISVPELIEPQIVNLRYCLKGVDTQWTMFTGKREIHYTALPPGRYLLQVQTTDATGEWNSQPITLPITIMPPWWTSWWMQLVYAFLLTLFLYVAVHLYRYRRLMIQKIEAYEKLMRQASDKAQNDTKPQQEETSIKPVISVEDEAFVIRCRQIIVDNLTHEDLSVEFLADQLCMSHSALYKKLRRITGRSVVDMILDCRIYAAVDLIRQGDQSLTSIADACGFSDLRAFRAAFKKRMGVPPSQYE